MLLQVRVVNNWNKWLAINSMLCSLLTTMASSSHRQETTSSSLRRFCSYLNSLQKEFDLYSNTNPKDSNLRPFNTYLGGLKVEFELLYLENESLRKERDEYKERGLIFVFTVMKLHC